MEWRTIESLPDQQEMNSLCVFFIPPSNYLFGVPNDIDGIRKDFPNANAYRIICDPPKIDMESGKKVISNGVSDAN